MSSAHQPDAGDPIIRPAVLSDAEAIVEIYNHEVATSTAVFDLELRTVEQQRTWLTDRSGAHAVIVAERGGELAGFASLSSYRPRPAYNTTVENSIYVHQHHRGRGVGLALLNELSEVAIRHGFHTMIGWVATDNSASVALHERAGFHLVGVQQQVGRKFGRWVDIAIMQKLLQTAPPQTPSP